MHQALGTDPQIRYLYGLPDSIPGRDCTTDDISEEAQLDPTNPMVGQPQTFWDIRACLNFSFGGASTGLVIIAWLAYVAGGLTQEGLTIINLLAGGGMAIGLFSVLLEIAR